MVRATGLLERAETTAADTLKLVDTWWRAANYLSVGQIYLYDNPLLAEPLEARHVKPRLLGHWGTTPGRNFVHAPVRDLSMPDFRSSAVPVERPGAAQAEAT